MASLALPCYKRVGGARAWFGGEEQQGRDVPQHLTVQRAERVVVRGRGALPCELYLAARKTLAIEIFSSDAFDAARTKT